MANLDKILEAFNFRVLQSVWQVRRKLEENGVSWGEFAEWVNEKIKSGPPPIVQMSSSQNAVPGQGRVLRRKCPDCGKYLMLQEVNTLPNLQVQSEFKCQWFCTTGLGCGQKKEDLCGWNEFSTKPTMDEAEPYLEEM